MTSSDFPEGCAFILGGSGQLGGAICRAFGRAGSPVAFTWHNGEAAARELESELGAPGSAIRLDARDAPAIAAALEQSNAIHGQIHSVVYAGGVKFTPEFFSRTTAGAWRNWFEGDAMGAINLATAALPYLRRSKGSFTALSTYQCEHPEVRGATSAVSKSAVDAAIRAIAKEEGRFGVRANSVRAGWFAVDGPLRMMREIPGVAEEKTRAIPLGRLGAPEELGETVVFLASRRAGFITGIHVTADGGESL